MIGAFSANGSYDTFHETILYLRAVPGFSQYKVTRLGVNQCTKETIYIYFWTFLYDKN